MGQVEKQKPTETKTDMGTGNGNENRLCPVLGPLFEAVHKLTVMILGLFKGHIIKHYVPPLHFNHYLNREEIYSGLAMQDYFGTLTRTLSDARISALLLGFRVHSNPVHSRSFE